MTHLIFTLLNLSVPTSNDQVLSIFPFLMLEASRQQESAVARHCLPRRGGRQFWILVLDTFASCRLLQVRIQALGLCTRTG